MSTDQTTLDRLDAALTPYGLTRDDVPGLTDAWTNQFGILDQPRPISTPEAINIALGNPDWGALKSGPELVTVPRDGDWYDWDETTYYDPQTGIPAGHALFARTHTRNGQNNRDHYHEYEDGTEDEHGRVKGCIACATDQLQEHPAHAHDEDDAFDRTYTDFWFKIPDRARAQILNTCTTTQQQHDWAIADTRTRQIIAGDTPPWRILADPDALLEHEQTVKDAQRALLRDHQLDQATKNLDTARTLHTILRTGNVPDGLEQTVSLLPPGQGYVRFHVHTIQNAGTEHRAAQQDKARFDRLHEEALTGVSKEMRDYLLGEREPRTYNTVEGTGRKRRTVQRTYTPVSDFVKERENAHRAATRAQENYDSTERALTDMIDALDARLTMHQDAQTTLEQATASAWTLGWPEGAGPAPDMPARPAPLNDLL